MTPHAKQTSGLAIASLVCGLVGLLLILPGPVAIILGIVALVGIRKQDHLKGAPLAIIGIITGLLAVVVPVAVIAYGISREMKPGAPHGEYPTYETMIGEGLRGSGFHFEFNGQRFVAASLHQFDSETPTKMFTADFEELAVARRVHTQTDVQILAYEGDELDGVAPLRYDPSVVVERKHPVAIVDGDTLIKGRVVFSTADAETGLNFIDPEGTLPELQGMSGSPVVSGETGTVIGVFIGTGFFGLAYEPLELPADLTP